MKSTADNKPCPLLSQDEMDRAVAASTARYKGGPSQKQGSGAHDTRGSRSTGRNRYIAETPEEKYAKERDTVIAYIIKTTGCSSRGAIRKMSPGETQRSGHLRLCPHFIMQRNLSRVIMTQHSFTTFCGVLRHLRFHVSTAET